ncbi:hypothetical protein [Marinilabilia rubra]|uniref:hypothetical protein n=1 Tax=Marinilabilia rubra TaxID=2162893 RepID=UPI001304F654|nr:hypothetical protein [Marinilabilia rubra]
MEKKVIETNNNFLDTDDRVSKVVDSVVESFAIEGIVFSEEELRKLIADFREEIKIRVE